MNRSIALLLIGLTFGGGVGFTLAAANEIALDGHDHAQPVGHAAHAHDSGLSLADSGDAPTIAVEALPDPVSGWNLNAITSNFRFAPENAGSANVAGEGHAHVYINGRKLGRLYGQWMHLDSLPAGQVAVRVSLNANDHSPLSVGDVPLESTLYVSN